MEIFISILYIVIFSYVIFKNDIFKLPHLPKAFPLMAFALKLLASFIYFYLHLRLYGETTDIIKFFNGSCVIYEALWVNPYYYLRLVFGFNAVYLTPELYQYAYGSDYWWHNGSYFMVRINALIQLFSFGYFSVHLVFISILMLWGSTNFYKLAIKNFTIPPYILAAIIFVFPATLFWTSAIHKEGIVYLGLSLCFYHLYEILNDKISLKHSLAVILGLLLIGAARIYLLGMLLPALLVFCWTMKYPKYILQKYFLSYFLGILFLVILIVLFPSFPLLEKIVAVQQLFLAESGGSDFATTVLSPNVGSLLMALPNAFINVVIRPFIWDCKGFLQYISAVESMGVGAFALFAFWKRKAVTSGQPLMYAFTFYAISNILFIGLLVSNSGTIMRYRSVALFLLVLVLGNVAANFNWLSSNQKM